MSRGRPLVDAHLHLWDQAILELPWLASATDLPAKATFSEFLIAAGDSAPVAALPVQTHGSREEAEWLVHAARQLSDPAVEYPGFGKTSVPGVVLQYLEDDENWAGSVQPLVEADGGRTVRAVRLSLRGAEEDWASVPAMNRFLEAAASHDMVVELLVRPDQLRTASRVARRFEASKFVVCHLGIGADDPSMEWRHGLEEFAAAPNTYAKLSGFMRQVERLQDQAARLREITRIAGGVFGDNRLMFGSDWPLSARSISYPKLVDVAADLADAQNLDLPAVFGKAANAVYALGLTTTSGEIN